jgi:uracil-DNA glycosylase
MNSNNKKDFYILPCITDNMSLFEIATTTTLPCWQIIFKSMESNLKFIDNLYIKNNFKIFPNKKLIFESFNKILLDDIKVVILADEPTYDIGYNGLAYCSEKKNKLSKITMKIYDEIKKNYPNFDIPLHGDISSWCDQGVILLNLSLTSISSETNKFQFFWLPIIIKIFQAISEKRNNCIYLLWGNNIQSILQDIPKNSVIMTANHPSKWFNNKTIYCDHFKKINELLLSWNEDPINWNII